MKLESVPQLAEACCCNIFCKIGPDEAKQVTGEEQTKSFPVVTQGKSKTQ